MSKYKDDYTVTVERRGEVVTYVLSEEAFMDDNLNFMGAAFRAAAMALNERLGKEIWFSKDAPSVLANAAQELPIPKSPPKERKEQSE